MVVGNPIEHSLSPEIHSAFAAQFGHDINYSKRLIAPGHFPHDIDLFKAQSGVGVNVTVPYKQEAFEYADELSPYAQIAGAVNTLHFNDNQTIGHNTDGIGLVRDLTERWRVVLRDKNLLLLGAGGASRGVILPLLEAQPASITIANRTFSKATALVSELQPALHAASAAKIPLNAAQLPFVETGAYDVVINATSVGLGEDEMGASLGTLAVERSVCYDMSYGSNARFHTWAMAAGCRRSFDGLGMLVEQAAESYRIWQNVLPQTEPVYAHLAARIAESQQ